MQGILFRPQYFSSLPSAAMSPLCGVRAIYISSMCISCSVFDLLTFNVGGRSLNLKCTYLGCLGPVAGDTHADQAPVPLTVILSGSGFDRGLGCFGLGCAWPIMGRFCTSRDRYTVVACARFRCDRWGTFWAGARQILVGFRVRSGYRWWDGRHSCENCTCTSILMA